MKIITISREFGSGGRELGKRMADLLGWDYYDREIITAIAQPQNLDEGHVARMLEHQGWREIPLTFRRSFAGLALSQAPATALLLEQKAVIEKIPQAGRDCIIVGRNADVLLEAYEPFSIFVCADLEAKLRRCRERAPEGENLSRRQMERNIRAVDKGRSQTRALISGSCWGDRSQYHTIINTTDWTIRELAPAVAEFASRWFERGAP